MGRQTTTWTDAWGRTTKVTPPTSPAVTYAYDLLDRLTSATWAGNVTNLTYDPLDRLTGKNS